MKVEVPYGAKKRIAKEAGATENTVRWALGGTSKSNLSHKILKVALLNHHGWVTECSEEEKQGLYSRLGISQETVLPPSDQVTP